MAYNAVIHVVPYQGVWAARKEGHNRVSTVRDTKVEAIEAAKKIAYNQRLDVVIHGKDGKIQKTIRFEDLSSDDCFITTACVKYFRLDDDCYQLASLREFRDNYLMKSENGRKLVAEYYRIAPTIVAELEKDAQRNTLFETVFKNINDACTAIRDKQYTKAKRIYKKAVFELLDHFKIAI